MERRESHEWWLYQSKPATESKNALVEGSSLRTNASAITTRRSEQ